MTTGNVAGGPTTSGPGVTRGPGATVPADPDTSAETARWAADVLARVQPADLVPYGSRDWLGLPEPSWARTASVVVAGECWRRYGAPAVGVLVEARPWPEGAERVRRSASLLSREALAARRALPKTRPGDWPGGRACWDCGAPLDHGPHRADCPAEAR